jgi:hypothetical protein
MLAGHERGATAGCEGARCPALPQLWKLDGDAPVAPALPSHPPCAPQT